MMAFCVFRLWHEDKFHDGERARVELLDQCGDEKGRRCGGGRVVGDCGWTTVESSSKRNLFELRSDLFG